MSVPTETSRSTYDGDGATAKFDAGFYFQRSGDLAVKLTPSGGVETVLVEGVDYTVTLPTVVGGDDGYVTMTSVPAVGDVLVIERDVSFVQDTSFRTQGQFSPAVHEDAMDRIVFQVQELARRTSDLESAGAPGSVIAGDGCYFSGDTLHVGAGNGIKAMADSIAILYGTAGQMVPGIGTTANDAGTDPEAARIDHRHKVDTAAPPNNAVQAGQSASEGTASTLARSDHTHRVACAAPSDVTKAAAAEGVATTLARSDHKHDVSTAAAVELTDASNAEGVATSLARSDHTHAHGARAGGTLHAVATSAAAGFMSAADKAKLDGLLEELVVQGTVQTTDATPTKLVSWVPDDGTAEVFEVLIVGKKTGSAEAAGYKLSGAVRRNGGATAFVSGAPTAPFTYEDAAAWAVAVSVTSPQVDVLVTGAAATTIDWAAVVRRVAAP